MTWPLGLGSCAGWRGGSGVGRLRRDLESGRWDARYGQLGGLAEYDAGYRLIVAGLDARA